MNPYAFRRHIIGGIIVGVICIYVVRLFYIQVIDSSYKLSAQNNAYRRIVQYPARGLIYDRNGKLLVGNQAAFDLMYNPSEIQPFDTLELCSILQVTPAQLKERFRRVRTTKGYSRYRDQLLYSQLSEITYARLQEKLYKYPGLYVQERTLRRYLYPLAAHLLGYVSEVDSSHIRKDPYYQMGDYIGISGIEKAYEKELRGKKGVKIFLVDVHNRLMGSLENGKYDSAAVLGKNLVATIDIELQQYAEKLMKPFRGSVVAIEPATGEILALVSSPSYDPSLLVGQERKKNFPLLQKQANLPLYNRALAASYPPGSTFKLINALIGQQENVINEYTTHGCAMGWSFGPVQVGCHAHPSPLDLRGSIQYSCNSYYCDVFRRIIDNPRYSSTEEAYKIWRNYVLSFGFGQYLKTDLPDEGKGNVPSINYYNKIYGKNRWRSLTIISLGIGQGELGITPLHMANMAATIANRGYFYTPHSVKKIEGQDTLLHHFTEKHYTAIDPKYFEVIIDGMEKAVESGTAMYGRIEGIAMCGKTGTAQNPHGKDHSIFICFAPRQNPRIAIAVYVENAGFGATWAVPVASLLVEKYLKGSISRPWMEERIVNAHIY